MKDVIRRQINQTPNRSPMKWEIWDLDLSRIRVNNKELDIDPDKPYRPYLIFSSNDYITLTNNVVCLPISGNNFYPAYSVFICATSSTGLSKDSYIQCHSPQTLEKQFLSNRRGVITDQTVQANVKKALRTFFVQP